MCAELKQQTTCNHTHKQRAITGTWISLELQKAVIIGYEILKIHEAWHYKETTQYDQVTDSGCIFAGYMDAFIGVKMEASGYPINLHTHDEKTAYVHHTKETEGVNLNVEKIKKNPCRRAVAKLCLNNLWGKLGQRPNMMQSKYINTP